MLPCRHAHDGINPHSACHFGYPLLLALPDVTTEVNCFDDLSKKNCLLLSDRGRYINYSQTTYFDLRWAKSVEGGVLSNYRLSIQCVPNQLFENWFCQILYVWWELLDGDIGPFHQN